jgi:hypothetical protein
MNMDADTRIRIICPDAAQATRAASDLRRQLLDADLEGVRVGDLVKEDRSTQDGGATLLLAVLSAPMINTLAQGIADWIRKRRIESNMELEIDGLKIKVSGDAADDSEKLGQLVAALREKRGAK